jgi:hypothetical protein
MTSTNQKKEYDEIKIIDNARTVGRKAEHIKEIALALARVGMRQLSEELFFIADDLEKLGEETRVLAQTIIGTQLNNATASTDNMMRGIIGVLNAKRGDTR